MSAEFSLAPDAVSYWLVFKGTIGAEGATAHDPVDQDIAIAAKRLECVPEPGPPVPNPLVIPEDTVIGTITVFDTTPVAFPAVSAGIYQIEYGGGALDLIYNASMQHYAYVTAYCGDILCDYHILVDSSLGGPFPGAATEAWGSLATLEELEAHTSSFNPMASGFWAGGPITVTVSDTFTQPGEFTYNPPGMTYRLRRTGAVPPQPERIRIQNWATLIRPRLTPCEMCADAVTEPEWDGTFPRRLGDTSPSWVAQPGANPFAIKGKLSNEVPALPTVAYDGDSWMLYFTCWNPATGRTSVIWAGTKRVGYDPTGAYFQDLEAAPEQCATDVGCMVVEAY